ncbi:MAG: PEP-CTERM sorting domain-containing protein [Pirellulaceae bacterium]|nr:PEP-CTERM sorting domain-containing protein [Pirellulaceae bacterium]
MFKTRLTTLVLTLAFVSNALNARAVDIFNVNFEGESADDTVGGLSAFVSKSGTTFVDDNGPSGAGTMAIEVTGSNSGVGYPAESFIFHKPQDNTVDVGDSLSLQFDVKFTGGAGHNSHASYFWTNSDTNNNQDLNVHHDGPDSPRWNIHSDNGGDFSADRFSVQGGGNNGMPGSTGGGLDLSSDEWHTLKLVATRVSANPDEFMYETFHNGNSLGSGSDPFGLVDQTDAANQGQFWTLAGRGCCAMDARFDNLIFSRSVGGAAPTDFEWGVDALGDWHVGSHWTPYGTPDASTETATFGSFITSPRTVVTDTDLTIQRITFANLNSYNIAGHGRVSLDGGTSAPTAGVDVFLGNHEFQAPVSLNSTTDINIVSGGTLTFNNELDLAGNTLNKMGPGTLEVNNQLTTNGGTVAGLLHAAGGIVAGDGTIDGDLLNDGGSVSPGSHSSGGNLVPEPNSLVLLILGLLASSLACCKPRR